MNHLKGKKQPDIVGWSFKYFSEEDRYGFRMSAIYNASDYAVNYYLERVYPAPVVIEEIVDIRDAIFTSGVGIHPDPFNSEKRWFHDDGVYYIKDNNVFIIQRRGIVLMMDDEERIYMYAKDGNKVKRKLDDLNSHLFLMSFLDSHLRSYLVTAREINPEYFGVGDCLP